MASSEQHKRLRAELAQELGFYPASLDPADIDRHRRLNAALDKAPIMDRIHQKSAHLREEKRQHEAEARGRAEVAGLYDYDDQPEGSQSDEQIGDPHLLAVSSRLPLLVVLSRSIGLGRNIFRP